MPARIPDLRKSASGVLLLSLLLVGLSCSDATSPETIDPPTGVTVVLLGPTAAELRWTASANASRVRSYNVIRNGLKIGETTVTTFVDDRLADNTRYQYAVSANGVSGGISAPSSDTPLSEVTSPDVTAPVVLSISPPNRSAENGGAEPVRVRFSEPIDQSTISSSSFTVSQNQAKGSLDGSRSYEAATNTLIFTPASPYLGNKSYTVNVTTGVKDLSGIPLGSPVTSCFTPTAGSAAAVSLTGFWAGNDACMSVHIHVPIVQIGNTLSLGACSPAILCLSSALSEAGRAALGGSACKVSGLALPRICDANAVSLVGVVSGTSVSFTVTFDNGVKLSFAGSVASTGTADPAFTGTIFGPTLLAVGINFDREDPADP